MEALIDHVESRIASALPQLPEALRNDTYALSLYTDVGDVEAPAVIFSFNTNEQVRRAMAGEIQAYGKPANELEARWNYAFWMHVPCINFFTYRDAEGQALLGEHLKSAGLSYSEADDFDIDGFEQTVLATLEAVAGGVAGRLRHQGLLSKHLGGDVPILIHQLEYHDRTAQLAQHFNPPNLVAEFVGWIGSM